MPLKWRTSLCEHPTLGRSYVIHWEKLDVNEILDAISQPPIDTKGITPPVQVHTPPKEQPLTKMG